MIRVLLVEDHRALAEGLAALLATETDLDVVGVAHTFETAVARIEAAPPDVVVSDVRLGGAEDGLTLVARLGERSRFVVYSAFDSPASRTRALDHGATAFVSKTADFDELLGAIRFAAAG